MMKVSLLVGLVLIGTLFTLTRTLTIVDLTGMVTRCALAQNFTQDAIPGLISARFSDDQATKCFLRCLGYEMKIYDDENGVYMHEVWLLLRQGRKDDEEQAFAESHAKCVAENLAKLPKDDYCGRTHATYICFSDDYEAVVKSLTGTPFIGGVFGI